MMKIGKFRKTETGFTGRIVTLELQSDKVSLVRQSDHDRFDVLVGEVLVGLGARRQGTEETIDLELDDPSFSKPIRAQMAEDQDGDYSLTWQRESGNRPSALD